MITIVALKCNLESILSEPKCAVPFVPKVNETLRHYIMLSLCVGSGASAESKVCSRAHRLWSEAAEPMRGQYSGHVIRLDQSEAATGRGRGWRGLEAGSDVIQ